MSFRDLRSCFFIFGRESQIEKSIEFRLFHLGLSDAKT